MQKSESDNASSRGRGRPRGFDRGEALAQATRLFWRKGYEATSVADLTAAMGIAAPSLYAAFGSKEALYVEALRYYGDTYEALVWGDFAAAATAREAVQAYLFDSAAALTGSVAESPPGCMVTLSSVDCQSGLSERLRAARSVTFDRIASRLRNAVAAGELCATIDVNALARFVQIVQSGMSILARDGASRDDLEAAARVAMNGWDAWTANSTK
jgi:AcrR family transcriptional regulator